MLGLDPVTRGEQLRPRIGVMLQSGGIYPSVRAVEMLKHTAKLYANPLDTDALVERLGLGSAGRTTFRRLSGGQQQRLSLALAVVGRPELVFLDEPTAGLDVQARHATWELIEQLRADGVTVVLTTHLLDEAERLADTVAIVDSGKVVAHDTPAALAATDGTAADRDPLQRPAGPGRGRAARHAADRCERRRAAAGRLHRGRRHHPGVLAKVTAWCAAKDVMPQGLRVGRRRSKTPSSISLDGTFVDDHRLRRRHGRHRRRERRPPALAAELHPEARRGPGLRMIIAQAAHEVRLMLRNPEQLLLTIVIPALMMVLFSGESLVATSGPGKRVDFYAPGLFGAAVLSTAFTGLAIATGFERRYGVLKRMGATPLPRWGLIVAKALCVLCVEVIQIALLSAIALAMGWRPHGDPLAVAVLIVLGHRRLRGAGHADGRHAARRGHAGPGELRVPAPAGRRRSDHPAVQVPVGRAPRARRPADQRPHERAARRAPARLRAALGQRRYPRRLGRGRDRGGRPHLQVGVAGR